ncbi:ribosome biogenesis GTPase Der [bacterium]|nr:ribosome biogenesis GTPase Der [bacterium]
MSFYPKKLPVVAIVGRPNVGKSTLFNKITRRRIAIIHDAPGITRDRHYSQVEWNGKTFLLVDTGGILSDPRTEIEMGVVRLVKNAVEQANALIFVVEDDIHPEDFEVANFLRKAEKPIIVVANKIDDRNDNWSCAEAEKFGLGEPIRISAKYGYGIGDLLDKIVEVLPSTAVRDEEKILKIAVVGRPNVGKSSFVNKLLGQDVALVHHEPGTTRDAVNSRFRYFGKEYEIVDTAGLFRKQREDIEYFSGLRTLAAIEQSDVVLLIVDATQGFTRQDKRIAATVMDRYRGLAIAVNKWDLIPEKTSRTLREFEEKMRFEAPFLSFVPIVFISALTGIRVRKTMEIIDKIGERMNTRIPTAKLNKLVQFLQEEHPPPVYRGRRPKILYAVQYDVAPPEFIFFAKMARAISPSYKRYITNQIRKIFDYEGVPFKLIFRDKTER